MSVISIETAAMSKSRLAKGFNGDSINLNRRISSVDEMNNGYRAAGKIAPPCVCAVASSCIKGVSVGAVTAFDDYSHSIYKLRSNAESEMKRYTDDMSAVAADCGEAHLSLSSVCIFGDKILASSVGGGKVFVCSSDGVREISSDDGSFSFSDLSDLSDGGFIVILGAECAHFADSELIGIVTSQSKNIKAVSKALFTSLNKVAPDADITGVFFKITASAAEPAVPIVAEDGGDSKNAEEPEQSGADNEKTEPDEDDIFAEFDDDEEEDEKKHLSAGKKLIGLVPFIVLAALVGIALAVYVFTGPKKDDLIKTTTPASDINANAEVTEPVTEPDNNNSDPETTTAGETTAAQTTAATTDNGRTTTRSGNSNTTRRNNNNNTTTQRPTAPPTTQKPTQPPTAPPTTQKPTQPPTTQKPTQPPTTQPTTRITDQGNDKPFG